MNNRKLLFIVVLALASLLLASSAIAQDDMMEAPPGFDSWDAVLEEARGQTVNWNFWGGSDSLNNFVDNVYATVLDEEYGITLNRVPLGDTVDAVNQVLSEAEAGIEGDAGSVDLIWINGENFATLKQADLLYGPWAQNTPNSTLVDWDNPGINTDFGISTDAYETPWASFPFQWVYDTARMDADDLPRSYADLGEWIMANPGRFTYIAPGPGAFQGTRIVKQMFLESCGGYAPFAEFDQALYDECAPQIWETLNEWEQYLWREGETYPATEAEMIELFANGEIDFAITQRGTGAAGYITDW